MNLLCVFTISYMCSRTYIFYGMCTVTKCIMGTVNGAFCYRMYNYSYYYYNEVNDDEIRFLLSTLYKIKLSILLHAWHYGKSPDQTYGHTLSGLSAWWMHTATFIFLRGLFGYVWVYMITLSHLSVLVRYSKHITQVCSQFEPLRCHFFLLRQVPITSA